MPYRSDAVACQSNAMPYRGDAMLCQTCVVVFRESAVSSFVSAMLCQKDAVSWWVCVMLCRRSEIPCRVDAGGTEKDVSFVEGKPNPPKTMSCLLEALSSLVSSMSGHGELLSFSCERNGQGFLTIALNLGFECIDGLNFTGPRGRIASLFSTVPVLAR
jgi:hypothetical protein